MRNVIAALVLLVAVAVALCAHFARKSREDIAPKVTNFLYALLLPMLGNLLIIVATQRTLSLVGRYLYAVGIDITMYCLLDFTMGYCGLRWNKLWHRILIAVIALDIVQFVCNIWFGHAFAVDEMTAYGAPYFNARSYFGRTAHLGLVYAIMAVVLVILLVKTLRGARIYSEKYSIIFSLLLATGAWEIFYLFSRTPVKRTVIAYGIFGVLVYYFSLHYRPRRLLDHLLANLASGMTDGLYFFDDNGRCLWADEHGIDLVDGRGTGFSHFPEKLEAMFGDLELERSEWECQRALGERYYLLTKSSAYDTRSRVLGSVLSLKDRTAEEQALRHERYIAHHDPLTGLYTKEYLYERIRQRMDAQPDAVFYIAYMDINNFKLVNDVFGKDFGDYTLQTMAADFRRKLPPTALYGRLGGDAFGFCFSEDEFDAEKAERYMSEFLIERGGITHRVVIHQGVYRAADRTLELSLMFDRAHIALQTIKQEYKRHIVLYDDAMREKALWDQTITAQLPDALASGEICPYLQPIVDREGKVIGAEALVRWDHPEHGLLPPARFVPVLEESGLIPDVDRHMWRCACAILQRWAAAGRADLFICINISPKDFYFMDLRAELCALVQEYGVAPGALRLEITETVMMEDQANRFEILRSLREAGFIVEMDDFGSGYNSLNMLRTMPVDVLKIDMMFLNDLQRMSRSCIILRSLVGMASELGLVPLTEGVETEEQYRILSQMGCQLFQGYLFARPMPAGDFDAAYLK